MVGLTGEITETILSPARTSQWIHSTALSMPRIRGQRTKKHGVAGFITAVAHRPLPRHRSFFHQCSSRSFSQRSLFFSQRRSRLCQRGLRTHTIALTALRTGRQAGQFRRRSGLQGSWEGLPWRRWWLRNILGALRLQCRLGQLDGRMVNPEQELVLLKQGQGLAACSWRMRLSFFD